MKTILSGNEAIARGAYEAGCLVASAYPGTPSTEILENLVLQGQIDASWAPNEKVALEVAIGASWGGARSMACMKHVGVNVAADPLMTLSYTGVRGGLVLVVADDPEMHSSQNEQDSRHYARFAKVPMLEPSDSEECRAFTRLAFELSERFDTPVMLRSCTRISHGKSIVALGEPVTGLPTPALEKNAAKLVMLPSNARLRHPAVEERLVQLAAHGETWEINRAEYRSTEMGVLCAGASYTYVREVLPEASILKLGMVHPLPPDLIRAFAAKVEKLYVVEELDPFIEEQVRAMGIAVTGKAIIPLCGELTPGRLRAAFGLPQPAVEAPEKLPPRPPNMCPGCPHRGVFYTLNQLKAFVVGDIGCYTLGFLPPLNAMDSCLCMGASISNASGIARILPPEERKKVVAVIGDSTFLHTGVNSLMEMAYNQVPATVIILDNSTTAMTGRQDNPGTGYTLAQRAGEAVDLAGLVRALGIRHVRRLNPLNLAETRAVITEEMERPEPSVIITDKPCVLIKREGIYRKGATLAVEEEKCTGCRTCLRIGCPAIEWRTGEGKRGQAWIDPALCNGCDVCRQLCQFEAIGGAQ